MNNSLEKYIPKEYSSKFRLKLHLVFWLLLFFLCFANIFPNIYLQKILNNKVTTFEIVQYIFLNTLFVIGIILILYLFYSKYIYNSKLNLIKLTGFLFLTYFVFYIYSILTLEFLHYLYPQFYNYMYINHFKNFSLHNFKNSFWYIIYLYFPFFSLAIFFKYLISLYFSSNRSELLTLLNKKNEIQFLKNQIQPHFVFNMLNGVYSLVVDSDKKSADAILKLSEMLRFSLYQSSLSFVPIDTEIKYIVNRIEIEKMYNGYFESNFKVSIAQEVMNLPIKPMILAKLFDDLLKNVIPKKGFIELKVNLLNNKILIETTLENFQEEKNIYETLNKFDSYLDLLYQNVKIENKSFLKNRISFEIII